MIYQNAVPVADANWKVVDISLSNVTVNGDFVVGFGSINSTASLGYDANLNNGRSWDYIGSSQSWQSYTEAYLIRALVEYTDGRRETLAAVSIPKTIIKGNTSVNRAEVVSIKSNFSQKPVKNYNLRDLLGYNIYRNGSKINSSIVSNTYYNDNGLSSGTYNYTVTAVYSEGESDPAGPVQAVVSGGSLPGPTNLTANNNEQYVTLNWIAPGGGGSDQWLKYHDNSFENSYASTNGGAGLAQMFSLPSYPATLKEVRFFVNGYGNYEAQLEVYIIGSNGQTVLGGPYYTNGVYNDWITIDISDFTVNEASFLVATYNTNGGGPYVSVDADNYNATLYFGSHTTAFYEMGSQYDDEYVGSHEAYVSISKNGETVDKWITPAKDKNLKQQYT